MPSEEDWRDLERWLGMSGADIEKEDGRGDPLGRRLKFGGDTGFNVRYSGWIDPHRADSSRAMGRNAAYWASTAGRAGRSLRDRLAPRRGRQPQYHLAVGGERDLLDIGALRPRFVTPH